MSSARLLQPLARAAQRQPLALRSISRPVFAYGMSTKAPQKPAQSKESVQVQAQANPLTQHSSIIEKSTWTQKRDKALTPLQAAMPQLVPFYFVNETVSSFGALVVIIYFMTKYALPQRVRTYIARLFISKL
ncbi:MAG: hypothetical protein Q9227_004028 [Pyrenula ochraceoflavens]